MPMNKYTYRQSPYPSGMNCILVLIIINVLAFLLVPKTLTAWSQLALSSYGIQHLRVWQPVTYMFLHADVMHILFNMYGLYLFGNHVLNSLGTRRFLILYFVSGISGAMLWLGFNWGSSIPVIGASGAVFGVMMAAAMLYPNMRIMLLFPPIPMTLKTFVAVFAVIEIVSEVSNMQGNVAHLAHLGGFLGAFVYIRLSSGERFGDIVKSPLRGFPLLGQWSGRYSKPRRKTGRRNNAVPFEPRSQTNRKTFEEIMKEIEELEQNKNRRQDDEYIQ
jgi:membrane associated rhomboid family serine protease